MTKSYIVVSYSLTLLLDSVRPSKTGLRSDSSDRIVSPCVHTGGYSGNSELWRTIWLYIRDTYTILAFRRRDLKDGLFHILTGFLCPRLICTFYFIRNLPDYQSTIMFVLGIAGAWERFPAAKVSPYLCQNMSSILLSIRFGVINMYLMLQVGHE